ncbi:MAG: hypothetical protein KatS3mg003_0768 [Candidatus Nitrosocaldaceae archaeon]|nr:MAG: hypothetical protein KatS3mg003_0768 [Candidatus Nitrosocaldaceae archaeon]
MKITIGIPSYNEESNILNLLNVISKDCYEIIIADDSNDNTPYLISKFASSIDKPVRLIHNNIRLGAYNAWNNIFKHARGDVIVLYDADVYPLSNTTRLLVSCINDRVGLVVGNPLSIDKLNIAALASSFNAKWARWMRRLMLSKYTTIGRALAIRSDIAKRIRIPDVISIDLYLQCKVIEAGYDIVYNDDAKVFFKPAQNPRDFLLQVRRAVKGHRELSALIKKTGMNPNPLKFLLASLISIFTDPLGFFSASLLYLSYPFYSHLLKDDSYRWIIANSTKYLEQEVIFHKLRKL